MSTETKTIQTESKSTLVVIRHSPYGSSLARSSLDTILAFAAFDQPISVLFLAEGVLQLMSGQDGKAIDTKTLSKQIGSLPLYGLETYYADEESLKRYALTVDELPPEVCSIGKEKIRDLVAEHNHVLSF
ncbi:MAG: sulfurtransferase complex subunit TusC [Halioglobus sp.]